MKRSLSFAAAVAVLAVAIAIPDAPAQGLAGVGGGFGGGGIGQIIQWVVTNIVVPLIAGIVIFRGCMMMFGRHPMEAIVASILGAVVVSQYQAIAGFFGVGG